MAGQLGASSYFYYWEIQYRNLTPKQLVEKTALLNLQVLQICDNLPLLGLHQNQLDELREFANSKNVTLEVGTRGFNCDELRAYIDITAQLGSRLLRYVPWSGSEKLSNLSVEDIAQFIDPLLNILEANQVVLAIENHAEISDVDLAELVETIDHPYLGVCLDTANSTGMLQQPLKTVEILAPYIVSLHLKDFTITKKASTGYLISGVPLGQGWLDVVEVLRILNRYPKQPNLLLELWMEPCKSHSETVAKENEWTLQSVSFIKHVLESFN